MLVHELKAGHIVKCVHTNANTPHLFVEELYVVVRLQGDWVYVKDSAGKLNAYGSRHFILHKGTLHGIEAGDEVTWVEAIFPKQMTKDKTYTVTEVDKNWIGVIQDNGEAQQYFSHRFKLKTKAKDIQMNKTEEFKNQIVAKNWIVGSWNAQSGISFSANPYWHSDEDSAKTEAQRLAKLDTSKIYVWLQVRGGARAVHVETF